jgi:hypothetical protein
MVAESNDRGEIHPLFAEALRADRESLNRRFSLRQRGGSRIDEAAFQEHLRTTVNDLVGRVASVQPERVRAVAGALFDVSLDLFAASLLGHETKHPFVSAAWREILPSATRLLARDPARIAGCLSNAVDYVAMQPGSRPMEWILCMRDLSPHCDSVRQWLDVGTMAAWRAGLVRFRAAALRLARQLPLELGTRGLGAADDTEPGWLERLDRLEADRWMSPDSAPLAATGQPLRIVRTCGGFRGFGGPCLRPPIVSTADGQMFVSDGDQAWQLLADVFGTLWQRVPCIPARPAVSTAASTITVDSEGRIGWDGRQHQFSELAESSSFACDGQTLAVTLPTSHHVFLLAKQSG